MRSNITDAERPWLEGFDVRRQATLIRLARAVGVPEQVALGLAGWLAVKAADLPDNTNGSTRARYRRLLRDLGRPSNRASVPCGSGTQDIAVAAQQREDRDPQRLAGHALDVVFGVAVVAKDSLMRSWLWASLCEERALHLVGGAISAAAALDVVCSSEPDVIVLDDHVQGVTRGADIAPMMKAVRPELRIVMFSDVQQPADLPIDSFVPKPKFTVLLPTVRVLLRLPLTTTDSDVLGTHQ